MTPATWADAHDMHQQAACPDATASRRCITDPSGFTRPGGRSGLHFAGPRLLPGHGQSYYPMIRAAAKSASGIVILAQEHPAEPAGLQFDQASATCKLRDQVGTNEQRRRPGRVDQQ